MTTTHNNPVDTMRIHFQNNDWRPVPFSEFRGILGLSYEQAKEAVGTLEYDGTIVRVINGKKLSDCKWKYAYHKTHPVQQHDDAVAALNVETLVAVNEVLEEEPVEEVIEKQQRSPNYVEKMPREETHRIFLEAFQVLKELAPGGATVEELFELVGRQGKFETLSRKFREAMMAGYIRTEQSPMPATINNGKGVLLKRFWVKDIPAEVGRKIRSTYVPRAIRQQPPSIIYESSPLSSLPVPVPAAEPIVVPVLLSTGVTMPTRVQTAVSDFNKTYLEILVERANEIKGLLASVEHLRVELNHIEELLKLHSII